MRRLFSDELNDLHARFSEMGMMVNEAIFDSVKAFVNHDKTLAHAVIDHDFTSTSERWTWKNAALR